MELKFDLMENKLLQLLTMTNRWKCPLIQMVHLSVEAIWMGA